MLGRGGLLRNATAGFVATAADFALVATLVSLGGVAPAAATFAGCLLGAAVNFTLNRSWSFNSTGALPGMAARYAVVSAGSAALNAALVELLLALTSWPYQLVWWLARGAIFAGYNYPLHKRFVFRHAD
ncbi:MAG TPA: GtrA family protein [Polyangiaceae bacterium]|nr:GtrA family protein [Polyangiaceae bacterium]